MSSPGYFYKVPFKSYLSLVVESSFGDGGAGTNKGCSVVPEHEMRLPVRSRERVWGSDREQPALVELGRVQAREWELRTANLGSLYPLVACLGSPTGSGVDGDPYVVEPGASEPPSFALHALDNGTPYKMKGCTVPEWSLVIPRGGGNAYQRYTALVAEAEVAGYAAGSSPNSTVTSLAFRGALANQAGTEFTLIPAGAADIESYDPSSDAYTDEAAHGESGSYAFWGGVRLAGTDTMVFAPCSSDNVGVYDESAKTYTSGPAHGEGATAFVGAAEDPSGGVAVFAPYDSANVGIYEHSTTSYTSGASHGEGDGAFQGAAPLADSGRVLLAPYDADHVGLYDPDTDTYTSGPAHGEGDAAFDFALALTSGKALLVPHGADRFYIYDDSDDSLVRGPEHGEGDAAFGAAALLACGDAVILNRTGGHHWRWSPDAGFYRTPYFTRSGGTWGAAAIGSLVYSPPSNATYAATHYEALACRDTHRESLFARQGTYELKRDGSVAPVSFLGGEFTLRQNLERDIPDVAAGRIGRPARANLGVEASLSLRASTGDNFVKSLQADEKGVWSLDWYLRDGAATLEKKLRVEMSGLGLEAYSEPVPTAETGVVEVDVRLVNYSGSPTFTIEQLPL